MASARAGGTTEVDVVAQRYWVPRPHTLCLELEETPRGGKPSNHAYQCKIP